MARKPRRAAIINASGSPKVVLPSTSRASAAPAAANSLLPTSAIAVRLGKWSLTVRRAEAVALLVITVLAGVLLLKNLGDRSLWQDEAQTALLAKTVLTDGIPRGTDGKNYFSQELGIEYWGNYVYRWHTWLSFYLVAGSFAVFGTNTFAARLPCALLGLASVPLVYVTARSLWQSRRAAALSAILLTTCVPFLILSRQCRYYSACIFFSLLGLWAYDRLLQRRRGAALWFVAAAVLLFHAFYFYWGVLAATVLIHAAIFRRDRLLAVALWTTCSFLLVLPWLIWYFWPPAAVYPDTAQSPPIASLAQLYLIKIFQHVFSPTLFAILGIAAAAEWIRRGRFPTPDIATRRTATLFMLFTGICIVALAVATPNYFFRYLAPVIPLLCMLGGRILESAMRFNPAVGVVGLAAILFFSPMQDYLYEITHHYRSPAEGMAEFLETHAKPGDVVAITYGDMPLKFYTNLRVVGGLTGEDMTPALKARWVIERGFTLCSKDAAVRQYLSSHLSPQDYRRHVIDYPDIPYGNRECPDEHQYRTALAAPPITIWERIEQ
jgi:hypothetical protein